MTKFSTYSDKYIRKQTTISKDEEALADIQAAQEVDEFLNRFKSEDKFIGRVISKLITKLDERYGR